jgi:flavin-dependent dehydrogenase
MQEVDIVIIGGGVAGLAAANSFCDLGFRPTILEANYYPLEKVCGEFLSPESLSFLSRWGITDWEEIKRIEIYHKDCLHLDFSLPEPAGMMARANLEQKLLKRALANGCKVCEGTPIKHIHPLQTKNFRLEFTSGEEWLVKRLIVSSGRCFTADAKPPPFPYCGFKAHHFLPKTAVKNTLSMHLFTGGYFGFGPISSSQGNIAMLKKSGSSTNDEEILQALGIEEPRKWLETSCPEFGLRPDPMWPSSYMIGDAAASIPPITGNGLSMAILSGHLAAKYAKDNDYVGYRTARYKAFHSRIFWGQVLHRLCMSSKLAPLSLRLARYIPRLALFFWKKTR